MSIVIPDDMPKACYECDYRCGLNIIARKDQDGRHENCPLVELPNSPWHTGTPTEEGWYLVAYRKTDCDRSLYWDYGTRIWETLHNGKGFWNICGEEYPVVMWQRFDEIEEGEKE